MKYFSVIVITLLLSTVLFAQQEGKYPLKKDVSTIDGIMKAYYEVVSGPAGVPRQVARDKSLHIPGVKIAITGIDRNGAAYIRYMTLDEFHKNSANPRQPFYEREISRKSEQFGSIMHVWSTYEWRRQENGPVMGRGINSIQLYYDGKRWWITSWIYDSERKDNPIPQKYLTGKK